MVFSERGWRCWLARVLFLASPLSFSTFAFDLLLRLLASYLIEIECLTGFHCFCRNGTIIVTGTSDGKRLKK
jgi:hypothetical protein